MVKSTSKEVINRFGRFSAPPPRHPQAIVLHDGYKRSLSLCFLHFQMSLNFRLFSQFSEKFKP